MEYRISKEECERNIKGICSRCGGKLEPIETVDNSRNPTYWSGCPTCCCFDNGVSSLVYAISKEMVEDGYKPYGYLHDLTEDDEETKLYKKQSQIGGTCHIVQDVLRIYKRIVTTP